MFAQVSFNAVSRSKYIVNEVTEEQKRCHNMEPLSEETNHGDIDWRPWKYKVTGTIPSKLLHGPASLKKDKSIMYPCQYWNCHIPCPCPICKDKHSDISFQDHWVYHQAIHLKCKFCLELIQHIPAISYIRRIEESPSSRYSHTKEMVSTSRIVYSWLFYHDVKFRTYKINKVSKGKECNKIFLSASHRKRHFMAVHYKSKFECSDCKKVFSRLDKLKRHQRRTCKYILAGEISDKEQMVEEEISENSYSNDSVSDEGIQDNDNKMDNDDEQDEASEDMDGNANLSDNDSESSLSDDTFNCNLCRKPFTSKFNFNVHTKKRKHDCQFCSITFCSKMAMKIHLYNGSWEENFPLSHLSIRIHRELQFEETSTQV